MIMETRCVVKMSHRSTEVLLSVFIYAAIRTDISFTFADISCPRFVTIEKNTGGTVSCDTPGNEIDYFWYKGAPSSTNPILQLEDGKPDGTEYGNGHFNISTSGAMTISNANLEHEGFYTFVAHFKDETVQSHIISVIITVEPSPSCPKIDVCNKCGNCSLEIKSTGHLTCSVNGVRPNLTLKWVTKMQSGISFVQRTSISNQNFNTGTWNTSTELSYEAFHCHIGANIKCVAQDEFGLLDYPSTSLRLHKDSENCTNETPDTPSSDSAVKILVITMSTTMVVLVVVLIVACFIHKRRNRNSTVKDTASSDEEEYLQLTTGHVSPPLTQLKNIMTDQDENFLHCLENIYKSCSFVQPLPWGNSISVSALYTGCRCKIIDTDGNTSFTSSDKLYTLEHIKNKNIVLIQGDKGSGKTMFLKYFVQRWTEDKEKKFLLFFISLKGITGDHSLVDTIKSTLFQENDDVTVVNIENCLKKFKCVLLLDGLNEMCFTVGEGSDDQEAFRTERGLTIGTLLEGETGKLRMNIQIWITTRKEGSNVNALQQSGAVRIEIMPFCKTEAKEYTMKVCLHYNKIDNTGRNRLLSSNNAANDTVYNKGEKAEKKIGIQSEKGEKESLDVNGEEDPCQTTNDYPHNSHYFYVCNFLKKYCIFKDFGETPDILILIIHILVAKSTSTFTFLNKIKIKNLADIIDTVIMCLEALYAENSNKSYVLGEWNALRKELEKAAFQLTFNKDTVSGSDLQLSSKMRKEAISIGILLQPKSAESKTYNCGENIAFRHRRFQEYFALESMVMNGDNFKALILELKRVGRDDIIPILKFVSCLEKSSFEELCEFLVASKFYNSFINCLHERNDQEGTKRILKRLCERGKISIEHLKRKDHRDAVMHFAESCKEMNIKLGLLSFREDCSVTYLTSLKLPKLNALELVGKTLSPYDFEKLLLHFKENEVTYELRLVECKVPEEMSRETSKLEQFWNTKLNVTRKGDIREVLTDFFNFKTGKWEKCIPKI